MEAKLSNIISVITEFIAQENFRPLFCQKLRSWVLNFAAFYQCAGANHFHTAEP